jgi:hypothetical protein
LRLFFAFEKERWRPMGPPAPGLQPRGSGESEAASAGGQPGGSGEAVGRQWGGSGEA